MFFDSKQFQVMTGSLQALSMQQQMILHNLANVETPGYKSKSVSLVDTLADEQNRYDLKAVITTDDNTSVRPDGNNVDTDMESMKLYENYVTQLAMYQKITGQFTNFRYVMSQFTR